jgi:endonuclease YncB( thermonuclease family)
MVIQSISKVDYYKRTIATCYADSVEINKELVKVGYAIAYKNIASHIQRMNLLQNAIKTVYGRVLLMPII